MHKIPNKIAAIRSRLTETFQYLRSARKIQRINSLPGNTSRNSPILFCILRNELTRLPYFLDHYRRLGVRWFFALDNNSTDGTREFLLKQEDITIFSTSESYQWNLHWRRYLLNRYGINRWCVMVDADELLIFDDCENKGINHLIEKMEQQNSNHLQALWVEMYSDKEIKFTQAHQDAPSLLSICPYFDRSASRLSTSERIFGWRTEFDKAPIVFYTRQTIIDYGFHRIEGDARPYSQKGVVMHFLYLSGFIEKVARESNRGVYFMNGAKYKCYKDRLDKIKGYVSLARIPKNMSTLQVSSHSAFLKRRIQVP